jgi:predicted TIM-barrel fold metal-dependent hydrolase
LASKDVEAYKSIVRAYNTYLAEEYCIVAPDRLIGNALVLETGVDDAIEEMNRCRDMGLRSVSLRLWPNGGDNYESEDDRFFAAALDIDMKLSPHATFGGPAISPANSVGVTPRFVLRMGAGSSAVMSTIGDLVYHGVFDRFPDLKFYFAETQAGWLPHSLNWADEFFIRWYTFYDLKLDKLPSEYVRDHCRFSFTADRLAMQFRYYIGLDLLMWGSDFPHSVGTFPHSHEVIEELFEGVPEKERRQILVDNVCNFFCLDKDKELTATPA